MLRILAQDQAQGVDFKGKAADLKNRSALPCLHENTGTWRKKLPCRSMCRIAARGSRPINHLRGAEDGVATYPIGAFLHALAVYQVYAAPQKQGELFLSAGQVHQGPLFAGLELRQEINIALGPELAGMRGAEELQPSNLPFPA